MTALLALIPRWVYAALIAMLAATSCKFKWDKDGLALEVEKHKVAAAQLEASQQAALAQAQRNYAATRPTYLYQPIRQTSCVSYSPGTLSCSHQ